MKYTTNAKDHETVSRLLKKEPSVDRPNMDVSRITAYCHDGFRIGRRWRFWWEGFTSLRAFRLHRDNPQPQLTGGLA